MTYLLLRKPNQSVTDKMKGLQKRVETNMSLLQDRIPSHLFTIPVYNMLSHEAVPALPAS